MKEFRIVYRNKENETLMSASKGTLVKEFFKNDEAYFKQEVERVIWQELTMTCVLNTDTGKISSDLQTADINPYGWRNA